MLFEVAKNTPKTANSADRRREKLPPEFVELMRAYGYERLADIAAAQSLQAGTVRQRLTRGWTPEQSLGLVQPPATKPRPKAIAHTGGLGDFLAEYKLPNLTEAARVFGVPVDRVRARLRGGMPPRKAFDLDPHKNNMLIKGEWFTTRTQACRRFGVSLHIVKGVMKATGLPFEEALERALWKRTTTMRAASRRETHKNSFRWPQPAPVAFWWVWRSWSALHDYWKPSSLPNRNKLIALLRFGEAPRILMHGIDQEFVVHDGRRADEGTLRSGALPLRRATAEEASDGGFAPALPEDLAWRPPVNRKPNAFDEMMMRETQKK